MHRGQGLTARILVNANAGPGRDRGAIEQALRDAGIAEEIAWADGDQAAKAAQAAARDGTDLLVVGGGDGTINGVAAALAGTRTRLGILPLGTLNHFARDLGVPADLGEAAKLIATGAERLVDVAEVNGRLFVNNSAIGLYPLMVLDREAQQSRLNRSKRLAMIVAGVRTLLRFNHQRLRLIVNDEEERVDTPLLFVGNNDYRLDIGAPGRRRSLEDGQLCVFVMRKKTRRGFVAASLRALLNRSRPDDMEQIANVQRLRVASHRGRLTLSLDGEVTTMAPPLDFRIRPRALRVIAP